MATYRIVSAAGVDMGTFEAPSPEAAHDAMCRDAGYESAEDAARRTGASVETLRRGVRIVRVDAR